MPPEPPRSTRFLMLDLWRGAAAFWVVLAHATIHVDPDALPSPGLAGALSHVLIRFARMGWYGVPLFFVISGYCIAATVSSHLRQRHRTHDFFRRRLRRIFPPYWAALAMTLAMYLLAKAAWTGEFLNQEPFAFPDPWLFSAASWFGNLSLTEGWIHHLLGGHAQIFLDPSWSLMYEEQFYVVCGIALIVFGMRFLRGAVVVTAVVILLMLLQGTSWTAGIGGFFFDGRWLLFALGLAVFHYLQRATARSRPVFLLGFVLALGAAVALRFEWLGTERLARQNLMAAEFIAGSGFAIILIGTHRWDEAWRWHPLLRPVAFLGRISYSLYIVHMPVAKILSYRLLQQGVESDAQVLLITVPVVAGVSVLYAWGFFNLVERRFLNSPSALIPIVRAQAEGRSAAVT